MQIGYPDQAFIDIIIGFDVGNNDPQQIIDIATHTVNFDNFRNISDFGGEILNPISAMLIGSNGDKYGHFQVQLPPVQ